MTEIRLAAQPDTVQRSVSSSMNNLLVSEPVSSQREVRQDMPEAGTSQPHTSSNST